MPIKRENRHRYPPDWRAIRAAILDRAGHRCERCGVPNHIWRNNTTGQHTEDAGLAEAWRLDGDKIARIVLTIAHLHDPSPENCDSNNLAALCQRCHNRLDAPMRARNARQTRRAGKALGDLFDAYLNGEMKPSLPQSYAAALRLYADQVSDPEPRTA